MRRLLSEGVDVNCQDYWNRTPLQLAMQENKLQATKLLLTNPDLRLDLVNVSGSSALHLACRKNSSSVIAPFCQDRRCTEEIINKKNKYGQTAVMLAVQFGALKCLKELDSIKSVDWETTKKGKSLIDEAFRFCQKETMEFLRERFNRLANKKKTDPDQIGKDAAKLARMNFATTELVKEVERLELVHREKQTELEESLRKLDAMKEKMTLHNNLVEKLKLQLQSPLGFSFAPAPPSLWRPLQLSQSGDIFDCESEEED